MGGLYIELIWIIIVNGGFFALNVAIFQFGINFIKEVKKNPDENYARNIKNGGRIKKWALLNLIISGLLILLTVLGMSFEHPILTFLINGLFILIIMLVAVIISSLILLIFWYRVTR